ncbi:MAG: nucleotidyltransferase [Anaerolineae bacterium]
MLNHVRIDLPTEQIRAYCDQHPIQRLAIFGSALRDDFNPGSDVDLLVEYASGIPVTLLDMAQQEIDLTRILQRKVDLRTPNELSPYFRQQVIDGAMVIYERAG